MDGLIYLYRTTFKNRLKKALHKPVTYIYLVIGVLYIWMIAGSFSVLLSSWNMDSPEGFVWILSAITCLFLPTNMITYAKKKGLLFRPSDVHFIFTSPISPKMVLLYAQLKTSLLNLLMNLLFFIAGFVYFGIPLWKMIIYFLVGFLMESVLETCLMICLYGNERLSEKTIGLLCKSLYLLLAVMIGIGVYLYFFEVKSIDFIGIFLEHPVLQCIPVIGWSIAFIRLLLLGPTVLNVICTLLYVGSALALFLLAKKMKCTGGYYEDAMKFADDYQETRSRQKKGEMVTRIGKKQKFKKARIEYKGYYSRAIFYRQLLEYKKNKYFIFGFSTLVCLIVGIALAYAVNVDMNMPIEIRKYFMIPIVSAYITFMFSGYLTKWAKELENPYTYLIPDKAIRKLWNATLIEHIRSLVDGCLMVLPAAIMMKLPLHYILLDIFLYLCLQANKLYFSVLSESLLGNVLGQTGKTILRMVGQMIVITIAVLIAVLVSLAFSITAGFAAMCIYMAGLTALVAIAGSAAFSKMETR